MLSHLFAGALIVGFVWAGFWQLDRLGERRAENAVIEARAGQPAVTLDSALARPADQLSFVRIADHGRYLEPELTRVANRSQNGLGGDWVVALFETDSGQLLLVNRGFATRDAPADPAPDGGEVVGWLQASQIKDGFFGATDTGQGARVPRLDVAAIDDRFDLAGRLAPVWLQLDDPDATGVPEPVPLPAVDERNHFSYALQWFTFATLSVVIYGLLLRKVAAERANVEPPELADVAG